MRMDKIKKIHDNSYWQRGGKMASSHIASDNIKWCSHEKEFGPSSQSEKHSYHMIQ